jgi:PAS domain S-box-containing protein
MGTLSGVLYFLNESKLKPPYPSPNFYWILVRFSIELFQLCSFPLSVRKDYAWPLGQAQLDSLLSLFTNLKAKHPIPDHVEKRLLSGLMESFSNFDNAASLALQTLFSYCSSFGFSTLASAEIDTLWLPLIVIMLTPTLCYVLLFPCQRLEKNYGVRLGLKVVNTIQSCCSNLFFIPLLKLAFLGVKYEFGSDQNDTSIYKGGVLMLVIILFLLSIMCHIATEFTNQPRKQNALSKSEAKPDLAFCLIKFTLVICDIFLENTDAILLFSLFVVLLGWWLYFYTLPFYHQYMNVLRICQLTVVISCYFAQLGARIEMTKFIDNITLGARAQSDYIWDEVLTKLYSVRLASTIIVFWMPMLIHLTAEACHYRYSGLGAKSLDHLAGAYELDIKIRWYLAKRGLLFDTFRKSTASDSLALKAADMRLMSTKQGKADESNPKIENIQVRNRRHLLSGIKVISAWYRQCADRFYNEPMFHYSWGMFNMYIVNNNQNASMKFHNTRKAISASTLTRVFNLDLSYMLYELTMTTLKNGDKSDVQMRKYVQLQKLSKNLYLVEKAIFQAQIALYNQVLRKIHYASVKDLEDSHYEMECTSQVAKGDEMSPQKLYTFVMTISNDINLSKRVVQEMLKINNKSSKSLSLYSQYLYLFTHDHAKAREYMFRARDYAATVKEIQRMNKLGNTSVVSLHSRSAFGGDNNLDEDMTTDAFNVINGVFFISGSKGKEGQIININGCACKSLGYTREELLGSNITKVIPFNYAANHTRYIANYVRYGDGRIVDKTRELVAVKKGGLIIPVILRVKQYLKEVANEEDIKRESENELSLLSQSDSEKESSEATSEVLFCGVVKFPPVRRDNMHILTDECGSLVAISSGVGEIWGVSPDIIRKRDVNITSMIPQLRKYISLHGKLDVPHGKTISFLISVESKQYGMEMKAENLKYEVSSILFELNVTSGLPEETESEHNSQKNHIKKKEKTDEGSLEGIDNYKEKKVSQLPVAENTKVTQWLHTAVTDKGLPSTDSLNQSIVGEPNAVVSFRSRPQYGKANQLNKLLRPKDALTSQIITKSNTTKENTSGFSIVQSSRTPSSDIISESRASKSSYYTGDTPSEGSGSKSNEKSSNMKAAQRVRRNWRTDLNLVGQVKKGFALIAFIFLMLPIPTIILYSESLSELSHQMELVKMASLRKVHVIKSYTTLHAIELYAQGLLSLNNTVVQGWIQEAYENLLASIELSNKLLTVGNLDEIKQVVEIDAKAGESKYVHRITAEDVVGLYTLKLESLRSSYSQGMVDMNRRKARNVEETSMNVVNVVLNALESTADAHTSLFNSLYTDIPIYFVPFTLIPPCLFTLLLVIPTHVRAKLFESKVIRSVSIFIKLSRGRLKELLKRTQIDLEELESYHAKNEKIVLHKRRKRDKKKDDYLLLLQEKQLEREGSRQVKSNSELKKGFVRRLKQRFGLEKADQIYTHWGWIFLAVPLISICFLSLYYILTVSLVYDAGR